MKITGGLILLVAAVLPGAAFGQTFIVNAALSRLEERGVATQLIVDGKPFIILGGELHNSSSSSTAYKKAVWPRLAAMNLNTALLPVAWETIEPEDNVDAPYPRDRRERSHSPHSAGRK